MKIIHIHFHNKVERIIYEGIEEVSEMLKDGDLPNNRDMNFINRIILEAYGE